MLRAVPSMIFMAPAISTALRSSIFSSAISWTAARDTVPTLLRWGSLEPLSIAAALSSILAAGGDRAGLQRAQPQQGRHGVPRGGPGDRGAEDGGPQRRRYRRCHEDHRRHGPK